MLSAIEVEAKANKTVARIALICLSIELKSFLQLVNRKIKITKIISRSNPEILSFSHSFKAPSYSKELKPCHETVTA